MICSTPHSGPRALRGVIDPPCDDVAAGLPADAFDGPNSIKRPYCREHFALIGPGILPDWLWPMQEVAGSTKAIDVCGNPGGELNAANITFGTTIAGWAGKFASVGSEANANSLSAEIGALWNIGNSSLVVLTIRVVRVSSGNRCLFVAGGNGGLQIQVDAAGHIVCFVGGATAGTFVYENVTPTPFCDALIYDRRGAGAASVVTNKETVTRSFINYSDDRKAVFGSTTRPTIASAVSDVGWIAAFGGLRAEALIDYGVANYIGAGGLGWS